MSAKNIMIKNLKRNSEFFRASKIRLDLFSFAKNEINENKKLHNDSFSFSSQTIEKPKENKKSKFAKTISINSQKTSNDSFDNNSDQEDSSEMSCDEENL